MLREALVAQSLLELGQEALAAQSLHLAAVNLVVLVLQNPLQMALSQETLVLRNHLVALEVQIVQSLHLEDINRPAVYPMPLAAVLPHLTAVVIQAVEAKEAIFLFQYLGFPTAIMVIVGVEVYLEL